MIHHDMFISFISIMLFVSIISVLVWLCTVFSLLRMWAVCYVLRFLYYVANMSDTTIHLFYYVTHIFLYVLCTFPYIKQTRYHAGLTFPYLLRKSSDFYHMWNIWKFAFILCCTLFMMHFRLRGVHSSSCQLWSNLSLEVFI